MLFIAIPGLVDDEIKEERMMMFWVVPHLGSCNLPSDGHLAPGHRHTLRSASRLLPGAAPLHSSMQSVALAVLSSRSVEQLVA